MPSTLPQTAVKEATKATAGGKNLVVLEEGFAPLRVASSINSSISNAIFFVPILASVLGWFGNKKWSGRAAGPLNKISAATGLLDKPLAELPKAAAEVLGETHALTGVVSNAGKSISKYANKMLGSGLSARLSQNSLSNTVFYGTMVAGEAADTALGFGARMRAIKQMQFDLTGTMPSTMQVLMGGKLHPLVQEARKELTGGRAILGTSLQVGGTLANVAMMLSGNNKSSGWKSMMMPIMVGMGTNMTSSVVTSGNTALNSYRNLHQHFAQAGRAPESAYVELIGGLAKNADDKMVRMFAKQCADKQLQPAAVLQMMAETSFFKKAQTQAAPASKTGSIFKTVLGVGLCAAGVGTAVAYSRGKGDSWVERVKSGMPRGFGLAAN